jgi:hypothetical protein
VTKQSPPSQDYSICKAFIWDRCGLTLKPWEKIAHLDMVRRKSHVFSHAVLKVIEQDELALLPTQVEETFPKAALAFFRKILEDADFPSAENDSEMSLRIFRREFDLRPDLFAFDLEKEEIRLHEIEDTNPLKPAKIAKIVEAFAWCASHRIRLRLFLYDRYGLNRREFDLVAVDIGTRVNSLFFNWRFPETRRDVFERLIVDP